MPTIRRPAVSSKVAAVGRLGFRRASSRDPRFLKNRIVIIRNTENDFIGHWK